MNSTADYQRWQSAIADIPSARADSSIAGKFQFGATDKLAAIGDSFCEKIVQLLVQEGFYHFVTEPANPIVYPHLLGGYNYGRFSARYGEIETARQLKQMLHRAYNDSVAIEPTWIADYGSYIDPYRPDIQPGGFATEAELHADRQQHRRATRKTIENTDVFIIVLTSTEGWVDVENENIFPVRDCSCSGIFDSNRHRLVKFETTEIIEDMTSVLAFVRSKNPNAKFILAVSPLSPVSVDSKASLCNACTQLAVARDYVDYFPVYEMISGYRDRDLFPDWDRGSISEAGMQHTMHVFLNRFTRKSSHDVEPSQPDIAERRRLAEIQQVRATEILAAICFAHAADAAGQPGLADERWREANLKYPEAWPIMIEWARSLEHRDAFVDARDLLRAFSEQIPEKQLLLKLSALEERCGDAVGLAAVGARGQALYPEEPFGHLAQIHASIIVHDYDIATVAISEFTQRFSHLPDGPIAHARLEFARGDYQAAANRWDDVHTRFPNNPKAIDAIALGRKALASHFGEPIVNLIGPTPAETMERFESLGGAMVGCEFGLVQRYYGVEPLGAMRWTMVHPDGLIAALAAKFSDFGNPDFIEIIPNMDAASDYSIVDTQYSMSSHTFIPVDPTTDMAELKNRLCRRMKYLADELLADLEEADKIFVYRCTYRRLTDMELAALVENIRRLGNAWLLYVTLEEDGKPNETVEIAQDGLMVGYIDRFTMSPSGMPSTASFESWLALCRKSLELREKHCSGPRLAQQDEK
ncbi:MAG: GSCFA domain-containing protein [Rhodospirillales bacterium]